MENVIVEDDYLQQMSVADAKVLLERTRREKKNKTKEMQTMIGVRYRDLIESADQIVSMHSSAMKLQQSLQEMPSRWEQVQSTLHSALTTPISVPTPTASPSNNDLQHNDRHSSIQLLVNASEEIWDFIERGEMLKAMTTFQQAQAVYAKVHHGDTSPFLETEWSSLQRLKETLVTRSKAYLEVRGQPSAFYSGCLVAVAHLEPTTYLSTQSLLDLFLQSRAKWFGRKEDSTTGKKPSVLSALNLLVRSVISTFYDVVEIFYKTKDGHQALLYSDMKEASYERLTNHQLVDAMKEWLTSQQSMIEDKAQVILTRIDSIATLASCQTKLEVQEPPASSPSRQLFLQLTPPSSPYRKASSPFFSILLAQCFRQRARTLVRSTFSDAVSTLETEFEELLFHSTVRKDFTRTGFYDTFTSIYQSAEALQSSEVQSVMTEELMRAVFRLVIFLEEKLLSSANGSRMTYLRATNAIGAVASGLTSERRKLLFPAAAEGGKKSGLDHSERHFESIEKSVNGRLQRKELRKAMEGMQANGESSLPAFLEEEIREKQSFGFHSFFFVTQIVDKHVYPDVFIHTFESLAKAYCQEWSKELVHSKIQPLHALLQLEEYSLSNEEWVNLHEGWDEFTIASLDDAQDEENELSDLDEGTASDGPSQEEKVWLPYRETPNVSSFLFFCCFALDEAYYQLRRSSVDDTQLVFMERLVRETLLEQMTLQSAETYHAAVDRLESAKEAQVRSLGLNFGERCGLQFLFDLYFVRATLGYSDFVRFGWGDEIDEDDVSDSLKSLKRLFDRVGDFVDPVDWEIYGPQVVKNVVTQFRRSRLLFSSLSEANDISEIEGEPIVISSRNDVTGVTIAEPVPRFSLLPVPQRQRQLKKRRSSSNDVTSNYFAQGSSGNDFSLFEESDRDGRADERGSLISGAGSSLLSSAVKGVSFLSSATTSYLREADEKAAQFF